MSEQAVQYRTATPLQSGNNNAIMDAEPPDIIQVSRAELEHEHNHLLARLHQLRRLLDYPPLITGKQMRKQHE